MKLRVTWRSHSLAWREQVQGWSGQTCSSLLCCNSHPPWWTECTNWSAPSNASAQTAEPSQFADILVPGSLVHAHKCTPCTCMFPVWSRCKREFSHPPPSCQQDVWICIALPWSMSLCRSRDTSAPHCHSWHVSFSEIVASQVKYWTILVGHGHLQGQQRNTGMWNEIWFYLVFLREMHTSEQQFWYA